MPQYELNLRDYWQIIRKRRIVLIAIFCLVIFCTLIYTSAQKPTYKASASVQWMERKTLGGMLTELVTATTGDPLLTQARVIVSRIILSKVVQDLGMVRKDATEEEIIAKADEIQGAVYTDVIENTSIIKINVVYPEPKLAAAIANKVAEVYIKENISERNKQNRLVREFIENQLEDVSFKLKKSEDILAKFKETEIPYGVALPLENKLAELDGQRQNLLQKYTALHPDVKNTEEQINSVKEKLKAMPQKELEYGRLMRDVEINTKLYRDLKEKLETARITEAEKVEDVSLVEPALAPGSPVSPNRQLNYLLGAVIGLMLGLSGTFLVEQLDTSIGTIEDVENYLKLPALGIIPYLKTDGEDNLTLIQKLWPRQIKGKEKILRLRNQLLVHYSSTSPVFESYRMLRTNIQNEVFKEKMQGKILLLSSSGPEEGKSITVSNLSIVMAQAGIRTLLIDADMRRSTIHKIFGLENKEPGLCDVLRGTQKNEQAIRKFTDILLGELGPDEALKIPGLDNLDILTSGSTPAMPAELLSSAEMEELLRRLRDKYDLILIDAPPVLAVADATIIADKTDGVILVYKVGKTARSVLLRTKTQLIESGAQVKGIVLNNISPAMEMRYGYYYQYKYYGKYYTPSQEKDKASADSES